MKKKIFADALKTLGVFGGIFILFFLGMHFLSKEKKTKWFYSDQKTQLISYEQEIELGELISKYLIANNKEKVLKTPLIDSVMWAVTGRLQKQIQRSEYDYVIQVLDNPQVNAFTLPGGRIYVFSGLLKFCDSPEQLTAVLAHEMGHIEQRHTVDKLVKEFGLKILFSILTGGDSVLLTELWQTVLSTKFDRSQEKEADQFALKLLEDAHISPRSMAAFFRKLNRENLAYDEQLEMLMTHPHNNSRIKSSLEYTPNDGFEEVAFDMNWKRVKEAL